MKTAMQLMLESLERVLEILPQDIVIKAIKENAQMLLIQEKGQILQAYHDGKDCKLEGDILDNSIKYYEEFYGDGLSKNEYWEDIGEKNN